MSSILGPELEPPSPVAQPIRHPVMTQYWADVVFLHWRYEPELVQKLLPSGMSVDVHDGSAWVALVPFRMERLGLPGLGTLPFVATFPGVNVRTYVHAGDRRGVWFFSLDIDLLLPTVVARTVYDLPYCYGRAHHERVCDIVATSVDRRWPSRPGGAKVGIVVRCGQPPTDRDPLTNFLTSRWGLLVGHATDNGHDAIVRLQIDEIVPVMEIVVVGPVLGRRFGTANLG